jgi:hypothetical protein
MNSVQLANFCVNFLSNKLDSSDNCVTHTTPEYNIVSRARNLLFFFLINNTSFLSNADFLGWKKGCFFDIPNLRGLQGTPAKSCVYA